MFLEPTASAAKTLAGTEQSIGVGNALLDEEDEEACASTPCVPSAIPWGCIARITFNGCTKRTLGKY